jgi:N-acetylneuraminic acid mutarotase
VQELRGSQTQVIGQLPQPRSDLSVVRVGPEVVVLGGYTGINEVPGVVATTTARSFHRIARLPVTVRYAATVAVGHTVWALGGEHLRVPIDDVQRIDTSTGKARIVGHLPVALSDAAELTVGGRILIAGGRTASGRLSDVVYEFDPRTVRTRVVGHLPTAVANAGAAVVGGAGYLFGGEAATQVRTVQRLALRPAS